MTNYIDRVSISNSYILIGSAYPLIILSLLLPIAMLNDSSTFYPAIEIIPIIKRFITHNILTVIVIPIAIYPYIFAIIFPVFLSKYVLKITAKLLTLGRKDNTQKYIMYPISFVRNITRIVISYIPITINITVYIGFYLMPVKPFLMSILGIIILTIMLFTNFYLIRQNKLEKERCLKAMYIATNYSIQSILYLFMIMIIMLWKDINLLIGAYLAIFAFILLLIGNLVILRKKSEIIGKV